MKFEKIASIVLGCSMVLSLAACGKQEVVETPEAEPVAMSISIINDKDIDITGISIYSDTRVDADEQTSDPENTGVTSLLGSDVLTPGDTLKVNLTVDDPMFNTTTDEEGNTVGEQKFVIAVTDINGNVNAYSGMSLRDGIVYTVDANGIYEGAPTDVTEATEANETTDESVEDEVLVDDEAVESADAAGESDDVASEPEAEVADAADAE